MAGEAGTPAGLAGIYKCPGMQSGAMQDLLGDLMGALEEGLGRFIVLWFILGGAVTFGVVVLTAQNDWPGLYYVLIWIGLGVLFSPIIFRGGSADPL